jgi:hypothetical protein
VLDVVAGRRGRIVAGARHPEAVAAEPAPAVAAARLGDVGELVGDHVIAGRGPGLERAGGEADVLAVGVRRHAHRLGLGAGLVVGADVDAAERHAEGRLHATDDGAGLGREVARGAVGAGERARRRGGALHRGGGVAGLGLHRRGRRRRLDVGPLLARIRSFCSAHGILLAAVSC